MGERGRRDREREREGGEVRRESERERERGHDAGERERGREGGRERESDNMLFMHVIT